MEPFSLCEFAQVMCSVLSYRLLCRAFGASRNFCCLAPSLLFLWCPFIHAWCSISAKLSLWDAKCPHFQVLWAASHIAPSAQAWLPHPFWPAYCLFHFRQVQTTFSVSWFPSLLEWLFFHCTWSHLDINTCVLQLSIPEASIALHSCDGQWGLYVRACAVGACG